MCWSTRLFREELVLTETDPEGAEAQEQIQWAQRLSEHSEGGAEDLGRLLAELCAGAVSDEGGKCIWALRRPADPLRALYFSGVTCSPVTSGLRVSARDPNL